MQKQLVCGDGPPSAARGHGSYRFCTSGLLSPRPTQDPSSRHPERWDPSSPRAARSPPSLGCTPRSCPEAWRPPGLTLGPGTEVTVAAAAAAHSGLAGGAAGDPRSQAQKPVGSRGPCVRVSGLAHRQTLLAGRRTPTEKRGTAGSEATSQGRGSYLRPLQRREAFAAGGARAAAALSLAEPTERPAAREALDQVRARCSQGDRSTCRSLFCPPCSPRLPSTPRLTCALLTGRYALTSLRNPFLNRKGRMQQTQGMKWTTVCQTVCRLTAERNRSPNATPLRVSPAGRVLGRAG